MAGIAPAAQNALVLAVGPPQEMSRATREVEGLIEHMDEQAMLGRNLATALRHLALGRHRRDVRDWLHDGVLPDATSRDLGLVQPAEDEDPEEQALDLVCAFSRLADSSVPLVLCFDQLEALQTSPDDREGLYAFGKMASALRDKTRNTLIISCVQTAFLDELDHIIRGADMDRLAEKEGLLKPLSRPRGGTAGPGKSRCLAGVGRHAPVSTGQPGLAAQAEPPGGIPAVDLRMHPAPAPVLLR